MFTLGEWMNTTSKHIPAKNSAEDFISHSPVKLVDEVILRAYSEKASDVHIEPLEHECRVRIRIDGGLILIGRFKREIHEEAIARLKVLSNLRTDIRMSPQDGRFKVVIAGQTLSIRLSVMPSFYGEKCVLRLLPHHTETPTLESLGFSLGDTEKIHTAIAAPNGMVLVVGPTGSGKTTTLYALLRKVSLPTVSAVSLEDPIEYSIAGVTQIPIQANNSLTFASALRAVVRQDPDVIMVGEIRDTDTAELCTHISLTGHLLLSTLHTNDAVTALPRLIDMEVEPFLIASTLRAVISQRLVRKLCKKCSKREKITTSEYEYIQTHCGADTKVPEYLSRAHACAACRNTGYAGRIVIAEVLLVSDRIRQLIMEKSSAVDLRKAAIEQGMRILMIDAITKVIEGQTTLNEIVTLHSF